MTKRKLLVILGVICLLVVAAGGYWGYRHRSRVSRITPSTAMYPVRGIDLSAHNGDVDFEKVKRSGIDFVILKATEGASFSDKKFKEYYKKARAAGLKVGAYHFFRFDREGRVQANHFLQTVKGMELDFPLIIDVEKEGKYPKGYNEGDIVPYLAEAIEHMELRGYDVMIYTNKSMYRKVLKEKFGEYPLWICSFTDPPGPRDWVIWQYSHSGRVPGVKGKVDMNVMKRGK